MSGMEMKTEVETGEFTDELSDEALDRAERAPSVCGGGPVVPLSAGW